MNKKNINEMDKMLKEIENEKLSMMSIKINLTPYGISVVCTEDPLVKEGFCDNEQEKDWWNETLKALTDKVTERIELFASLHKANMIVIEKKKNPENKSSKDKFSEEKCKGCPAYDECKSNK